MAARLSQCCPVLSSLTSLLLPLRCHCRRPAEEEWRKQYNREERKKRFVEQGMAEKRAAKKGRWDKG